MADLSPVMLNQVLEATLAFMVLLLAMSVTAIIRVGSATSSATGAESEPASNGTRPERAVRLRQGCGQARSLAV